MAMRPVVRGVVRLVSSGLLLASAGCSSAPTEGSASLESASTAEFADTAVIEPGGAHQLPYRTPERVAAQKAVAAAGPHLTYYGGKVLQDVKIVLVRYGTGTYLSNITSTTAPSLASFYSQWTASPAFTWLSEYDAASFKIGAGSFSKAVQITPSSTRDKSTISDTQIQAEISAQITAGKLPAPDNNTVYMSLWLNF